MPPECLDDATCAVLREVDDFLQNHREDTPLSGMCDIVPGALAVRYGKAITKFCGESTGRQTPNQTPSRPV